MGDREPDLKSSSYFAPADKEIRKTGRLDSASKKPEQVHGWRHPRELRGRGHGMPCPYNGDSRELLDALGKGEERG